MASSVEEGAMRHHTMFIEMSTRLSVEYWRFKLYFLNLAMRLTYLREKVNAHFVKE